VATTSRANTRIALALIIGVLIVAIATGGLYYYSQSDCGHETENGDGFYIQIVNSTKGNGLASLPVDTELIVGCTSGTGPQIPTIHILGSWTFETNATGFVVIPSSDLSGSAIWYTVASGGTTYMAKAPICSHGITIVQLSIPAGTVSGSEIPCGAHFQGNATIS
jgi:hypothetical protein